MQKLETTSDRNGFGCLRGLDPQAPEVLVPLQCSGSLRQAECTNWIVILGYPDVLCVNGLSVSTTQTWSNCETVTAQVQTFHVSFAMVPPFNVWGASAFFFRCPWAIPKFVAQESKMEITSMGRTLVNGLQAAQWRGQKNERRNIVQ